MADPDNGVPKYQEDEVRDLYEFLTQWFKLFPGFLPNQFYPIGESYGGKSAHHTILFICKDDQSNFGVSNYIR